MESETLSRSDPVMGENYIQDGLDFLQQFEWIHNFQVTQILEGPLERIPSEWAVHLRQLGTEELNYLPFLGAASRDKYPNWPSTLHNILEVAERLSMPRTQVSMEPTAVGYGMARGMNPKKLHEVSYMASLVKNVMDEGQCNIVVDVGSGLGYLDHVLHQTYAYPVIGLETSDSHVSGAESRAVKQGVGCGGIQSIKFNLVNDSSCFDRLEQKIIVLRPELTHCNCSVSQVDQTRHERAGPEGAERSLTNLRICLVGLHCCGDLSPAMLALYHHLACVKAICFVSCCYHKMTFSAPDICPYFPLSAEGRKCYTDLSKGFISPQTLRLGAQETRQRWRNQLEEDHRNHTRHVVYRALLENIDCCDVSVKRKLVRKCDFSSFEAFLTSFFSSSIFSEEEKLEGKRALKDLHHKKEEEFFLVEIITALQVVVQPVVETLIYFDRLRWCQENGDNNVKFVPIFDDAVSPRNVAIVSYK